MKAKEAVKKLGEIFNNLTDDQQKEAIRIAIRAIDQLDREYQLYQIKPIKTINYERIQSMCKCSFVY